MVTFQIQTVIVNELATRRGTDLRMETLSRISCIQLTHNIPRTLDRIVTDPLFFCLLLFDRVVDSTIMKVFSAHF
jgi:hypothetical protein